MARLARTRRSRRGRREWDAPKAGIHAYLHCKKRAQQRFGVLLTHTEWQRMNERVKTTRTRRYKQSASRTMLRIHMQGALVWVVWQRGIGVLTVLTDEMAETWIAKEEGTQA